ncbi:MAG: FHA domain-containing protein [Polyangiaceae bacterium]|nr:FHA domain-containing protein [Polyangiaceae bacterium]
MRNRGTILGEAIRPARSALGPREAFLVAHEKLSMLARIAPQGAFVIAVLGPDARVLDAFQILDRTALIIGRHSRCGLVLPHDALCLRHLAVLVRSERVHVWDLNTHQPFSTEDGPSSAVVADGPLYVSLGEYAFWIVPACSAADGSLEADEALAALPPRKVIDHRVSGRKTAPSRAQVRMPPDPVSRSITCLTRLGPPLLVGEGDAPEIGWGVLRFEFQGQKEKRHVSAERLEQGLLVGRYNRCGISFGQCIQMSRVHMLLVRIDDELWAIDTASSNGVRRAGVRVTAEVLADDDALEMAGLAIRWRRHKLAQA